MQNLSYERHHDHATGDSYDASYGGHLSLWFPNKQSQLCLPNDVEMRTRYKLPESPYQEHDLSSTRSCEHSNLEADTSGKTEFHTENISVEPGFGETFKKKGECCVTPHMAYGNADYIGHQVSMEHYNPSLDCISYPFAGSYFGRTTSAYAPNSVVYPQMMGLARTGSALPLDSAGGIIPIYVNAKQYHAILRRRQARAKLEAQNKVTKSRKPYLHESRHRHALKRARGSGGRFLNTKNMQEPKPSTQTVHRNLVLSMNPSNSESKNRWGGSTLSGSDVSCIFNNDDIIFQHPNLGVPIDSLTRSHDRMTFSVDGCRRTGTTT